MEYIYLGSSLPRLGTPELTAEKNIDSIQSHIFSLLDDVDKQQFQYLILKNDNKNFLHILRKREQIPEEPYYTFHRPSLFTYQELEAGIDADKPLPSYMKIFLGKFNNGYEGRKAENALLDLYFQEAIDSCGIFLSDYFQFKRNIKNILTGLNAKKFNYPLSDCLLGTGFVVETILKSTSSDLGLGKYYPFIDDLSISIDNGDLETLERKIDNLYINYLDLHTPMSPFSEDAIFLYFIKLMIRERWLPLNEKQGMEELNRNLNWVVNSIHNNQEIFKEAYA